MRISKVTTKTGDKGLTGLGNDKRVSKNHVRVNTLGSIDHLKSIIGWVTCKAKSMVKTNLESIQQDLFNLGGEISMPDTELILLKEERIFWLESEINKLNSELPPLKEFILPGGSELSARIHLARSECRNTERDLVTLFEKEKVRNTHLQYLNRLSDYLFVLARKSLMVSKKPEIQWENNK